MKDEVTNNSVTNNLPVARVTTTRQKKINYVRITHVACWEILPSGRHHRHPSSWADIQPYPSSKSSDIQAEAKRYF
jgi:hypothetical protein